MDKQLIMSIGREYGSGGLEIAERLSEIFDIPVYDKNIIENIAAEKGVPEESLAKYVEAPRKLLFSRSIGSHSNSPEEVVADMEFSYIKELAASGKSFIVVGRCSDELLRDYPGFVSIFVWAEWVKRIERLVLTEGYEVDEAERKMKKIDKERKAYHDFFCESDWGERSSYDLCINAGKIGIDKAVEVIENYIRTVVL